MLKILVCVKQVPESCEVAVSGEDFTLDRSGTAMACNPADERAFETALCLQDGLRDRACGSEDGLRPDAAAAEITLISMGRPGASQMLRELSAIGGERFYLISDPSFAGADTFATAEILRRAITFLGDFDLILCGERAVDGETGQVGPELAALLCRPFAGYAKELTIKGLYFISCVQTDGKREYPLPAVVSVSRGCVLRSPGIAGLRKAEKTGITVLSAKDLGGSPESLTRVLKMKKEEVKKRKTAWFPPDEKGVSELMKAAGIRAFLP